jgi:hypothetical protein
VPAASADEIDQPAGRSSGSTLAQPAAPPAPQPDSPPVRVYTEKVTADDGRLPAPTPTATSGRANLADKIVPPAQAERKAEPAAASGHSVLANAIVFVLASSLAGFVFLIFNMLYKRGVSKSRRNVSSEAVAARRRRIKRTLSVLWTGSAGARPTDMRHISPVPEQITMRRRHPAPRTWG